MGHIKYCIVVCLFSIILSCVLLLIRHQQQFNNVCKTFEDYYTDRDRNENCYYNPNGELSTPDIIKRHGYPVETYEVITKDGYILTTFRIPYGKNSTSKQPGKPVFVQHGMATNSGAFIIRNEKSLGFILADAGYDVWLGNFRGSRYSKNHIYLKPNESEFWDFTFHEIGIYDLPAQVNLVYKTTNEKLIYIGYSMGATSAYVYGSVHTKDALDKVKTFINLAPPMFVQHASLSFAFVSRVWPLVKLPLKVLTSGGISARPLPDILLKLFCSSLPFQTQLCQFSEMLIFGIDYEQADPETLPITFQQNADFVSIKALTHYFQMVLSQDFYHFDYGNAYNIKIYGSPSPPVYNLSNFHVPSYTFVGKNDLSATKENIFALDKMFREEGKVHHVHVVEHEKFNHFDFLNAKDIVSLLYDHILNIIRQL